MADVDRAIERILQLVVKTPKFKGYVPSQTPDLAAHAKVCKTVADEGVVLLKNEKTALPVSRDQEIALFGTTSYDFIAGGTGSGDVNRPYVVDLMTGLSNLGFKLEPEVDAFYKSYMADEAIRRKRINGNNKCHGHSECDAIIMDNAVVQAVPGIEARSTEAMLIHEAAIGKIAGDQLLKLETLGLTAEEAEDTILQGFLAFGKQCGFHFFQGTGEGTSCGAGMPATTELSANFGGI